MNQNQFYFVRSFALIVIFTVTSFDLRADWTNVLETIGGQVVINKIDKKIKIRKMKVVERYGNRVILDVQYNRVYRPNNVEMEAYVLRGGNELDGFESTIANIDDANGEIRLTVLWESAEQSSVKKSDQIKIVMSREGLNIKTKAFNFNKQWTAAIEEEQLRSEKVKEVVKVIQPIETSKEMPNIVGQPVDEAIAILTDKGLFKENIDITEEFSGGVNGGNVITQEPEPGSKLENEKNLKVNLVVETFTKGVPDLKGKTVAEAEVALSSEGLKLGTVSQERSGRAAGGTVLSSNPAKGLRVVPDTAVNLVVETDTIPIPNLAGQKYAEAKQVLENLGLRVGVELVQTPGEALRVLSTKPAFPENVLPGARVVLVVIEQMVTVANMVGYSAARARKIIRMQNLKLRAVRSMVTASRPSGTVVRHIPAKGATVRPNYPVTLVIARNPPRPKIVAKGTYAIHVHRNQKADLDRGRLNAGHDADISLKFINSNSPPLFMALNGARFGRMSARAVGWKGCSKSRYDRPLYSSAILKGRHLCVRTRNGKYSELKIIAVPRKHSTTGYTKTYLRFSFNTWSLPTQLRRSVKAENFSSRALDGLKVIRRELEPTLRLESE